MSEAMYLLSCLSQSVAHELRTGLSVLNNELTYLKSKLDDDETERALERCRRMSDYLRRLTSLGGPRLELSVVALPELLALYPYAARNRGDYINANVSVDTKRWEIVNKNIDELFHEAVTNFEFEVHNNSVQLDFTFQDLEIAALNNVSPLSLTEFFNILGDRDNIFAPLADTIIWAHGARMRISSAERGTLLTIILPRIG